MLRYTYRLFNQHHRLEPRLVRALRSNRSSTFNKLVHASSPTIPALAGQGYIPVCIEGYATNNWVMIHSATQEVMLLDGGCAIDAERTMAVLEALKHTGMTLHSSDHNGDKPAKKKPGELHSIGGGDATAAARAHLQHQELEATQKRSFSSSSTATNASALTPPGFLSHIPRMPHLRLTQVITCHCHLDHIGGTSKFMAMRPSSTSSPSSTNAATTTTTSTTTPTDDTAVNVTTMYIHQLAYTWYSGIIGTFEYLTDFVFGFWVAYMMKRPLRSLLFRLPPTRDNDTRVQYFTGVDGQTLRPPFSQFSLYFAPGHTDHMLTVYNTEARVLYVSDFLTATGKKVRPPLPIDDTNAYVNTTERMRHIDVHHLLFAHGYVENTAQHGGWGSILTLAAEDCKTKSPIRTLLNVTSRLRFKRH